MTIEDTEKALGRKLTRYEKGAIRMYNECIANGYNPKGDLKEMIIDLMLEMEERGKLE